MTLSQNFIKDPFLVKELLSASSIDKSDLVIEIGPGRGVITNELIKKAQNVIAIEKDTDLYQNLIQKFKEIKNLKIFNQDFLKWDLPKCPYKIFSNIPFNITAEIIDKIMKSINKPEEIYFIIQTEAAEKYTGTDNYETQNSILSKIFYETEILGDIDRTSFTPKPQVDISFIKFSLKENPLIDPKDYQQFRDFVIYGFNQWQTDVAHAFKKIFSFNQIKLINKKIKINNIKPSQLSVCQWIEIFDIYQKFVSPTKKELVDGFEKKYLNYIRVKK